MVDFPHKYSSQLDSCHLQASRRTQHRPPDQCNLPSDLPRHRRVSIRTSESGAPGSFSSDTTIFLYNHLRTKVRRLLEARTAAGGTWCQQQREGTSWRTRRLPSRPRSPRRRMTRRRSWKRTTNLRNLTAKVPAPPADRCLPVYPVHNHCCIRPSWSYTAERYSCGTAVRARTHQQPN